MPSNDMIERVATAIYEDRNGPRCKAWAHLPKAHQEPYLKDARVAVGAMMEGITPAMLKSMEEMYMPFGEMRAAWDGAFIAALHPIQNGEGE